MNILLAIDGSAYSHAAVDELLSRPWPADTHVMVLSVVEAFHPEYAGWQADYVPAAMEAQKEVFDVARKLVNETLELLAPKFGGEQLIAEVKEGNIKHEIIETARNWPADLVIMGSHGRKGITKFLLGSVSEGVLADAPCSVEIIKLKDHSAHA
ncbi:MAG: universal stress protein [Candidatus Melainabacteria bacterium]|nr:universal stress protein [Candidatus Melainabacteria bacterium]